MAQTQVPDKASLQETLKRLAEKPGVQATLVLSRKDGAVIDSTGFATVDLSEQAGSPNTSRPSTSEQGPAWRTSTNGQDGATNPETALDKQQNTAADTARAVFKYAAETSRFTTSACQSEDVQLLRIRTKKQEIVIVPDQNYLMVVFQDVAKSG